MCESRSSAAASSRASSSGWRGWALSLSLASCLLALPSHAASPEERALARVAAEAGVEAFKAGQYDQAVTLLEKAERLVHAPPHLLYIGRAYIKQGRYVRAKETLLTLLNEPLEAGAPRAFHDSQEIGRELLEEIEPLIAKLTVRIEGTEQPVRVTIDGVEIPSVAIGLPYPIDPGVRTIAAQSDTLRSNEESLSLEKGDEKEVVLKLDVPLETAEPAPTPAPGPSPPPPPQDTETTKAAAIHPLTWVGAIVAGAGLLTGTVTGVSSLNRTSSTRDDHCEGDVCASGARKGIKAAKTLANVSNVSFVVAVVGVGLGIYGFVRGGQGGGVREPNEVSSSSLVPKFDLAIARDSYGLDARWDF